MQLEVKIDQEAVQQQIVQAIMNSTIGKEIEAAIGKMLQPQGSWSNKTTIVEDAVNAALRTEMARLASELVASKRDQIREQMTEKLTDEVLQKMTNSAWAVMEGRLRES